MDIDVCLLKQLINCSDMLRIEQKNILGLQVET